MRDFTQQIAQMGQDARSNIDRVFQGINQNILTVAGIMRDQRAKQEDMLAGIVELSEKFSKLHFNELDSNAEELSGKIRGAVKDKGFFKGAVDMTKLREYDTELKKLARRAIISNKIGEIYQDYQSQVDKNPYMHANAKATAVLSGADFLANPELLSNFDINQVNQALLGKINENTDAMLMARDIMPRGRGVVSRKYTDGDKDKTFSFNMPVGFDVDKYGNVVSNEVGDAQIQRTFETIRSQGIKTGSYEEFKSNYMSELKTEVSSSEELSYKKKLEMEADAYMKKLKAKGAAEGVPENKWLDMQLASVFSQANSGQIDLGGKSMFETAKDQLRAAGYEVRTDPASSTITLTQTKKWTEDGFISLPTDEQNKFVANSLADAKTFILRNTPKDKLETFDKMEITDRMYANTLRSIASGDIYLDEKSPLNDIAVHYGSETRNTFQLAQLLSAMDESINSPVKMDESINSPVNSRPAELGLNKLSKNELIAAIESQKTIDDKKDYIKRIVESNPEDFPNTIAIMDKGSSFWERNKKHFSVNSLFKQFLQEYDAADLGKSAMTITDESALGEGDRLFK